MLLELCYYNPMQTYLEKSLDAVVKPIAKHVYLVAF